MTNVRGERHMNHSTSNVSQHSPTHIKSSGAKTGAAQQVNGKLAAGVAKPKPRIINKRTSGDEETVNKGTDIKSGAKRPRVDAVAAWCEKHGLDIKKAKKRGLCHVSRDVATLMLGYSAPGGGIVIPYFDREGSPLLYRNHEGKRVQFFRIRFDDPTSGFLKNVKQDPPYGQPRGKGEVHVYFDPCAAESYTPTKVETRMGLIITEGEAKAMALNDHGFLAVGLGGVNMWGGKREGQVLSRELEELCADGREVTVVFDSDARINPQVKVAMYLLVRALTQIGVHAMAYYFEPSPNGEKVGADDYLLNHSADDLRKELAKAASTLGMVELYRLLGEYALLRIASRVLEIPGISAAVKEKPKVIQGMVQLKRESYDALSMWTAKDFGTVEAAALVLSFNKDGSEKWLPAVDFWLESKGKTTYEKLVYEPGEPRIIERDGRLYYNRWEGPGVEPKERDTKLWEEYLDHLIPDSVERIYIEQWIAAQVRNPGLKILQSIVLWSKEKGVGKSYLGYVIGLLLGLKNRTVIEQPQLEGQFNEYVKFCTLLQIEEAHMQRLPDAKKVATKLNNLVTLDTIPLNEKYEKLGRVNNPLNLLITSNFPDAIYVASDERRWRVIHATEKKTFHKWVPLLTTLQTDEGLAALLWRMHHEIDMEGFDASDHAPQSEALKAMAREGEDDGDKWAREYKENPTAKLSMHVATRAQAESTYHSPEELYAAFKLEYPDSRMGKNQLGNRLSGAGCRQVEDAREKGKSFRITGTDVFTRLWISNPEKHRKVKPENIMSEYLKDRKTLVAELSRERKYAR